jgi:putative PIN family toxin of toxin-antitoxin system
VRAVLDANVLISALLSPGGAPAGLTARWLAGDFELIASERLLVELERALAYPKLRARIDGDDAAKFVSAVRRWARLAPDVRSPPARSAAADEDYVVALAENERAVLVSGDQHLLQLAGELPVYPAREFLEALDAGFPTR